MSHVVEDRVVQARDAYQRHAWHEAFDAYREADKTSRLSAADLASLAEAAWFAGHPDVAIDARQRAHAAFLADGDRCRAAEMALQLAGEHFERLETAIGSGWMRRAKRLLDAMTEECSAHGWQAIAMAMVAFRVKDDREEALRYAKLAEEIGARLDNRAIHALGLQLQGAALVSLGQIDEGLELIDEATVSAVAGELDPHTTGIIYCSTINVCRDLTDWRRAGEWTDAAERWCERQGISGFPGICRVHRAEIMNFRGSWADAEREARRACEELGKYTLMFSGKAQYEVGEVRLRVGDLAGAREAFRRAHDFNCSVEPGMSMLRLAEGDVAAAHASIKRALAQDKSKTLNRVRLLPAAVEIGLAAGDLGSVREAVAELEQYASTFRTTALAATVAYGNGRLLMAEGNAGAAVPRLREAIELWHEIGAPYEVARARTALAEAFLAEGDQAEATLELETAKAAFEQLGALPDARRVAKLLGADGTATRAGERVRRTFVFTDIVGSTPLAEALGDEAWQELIRWHDQSLRSIFDRFGGMEVRHTGDGFFVVFEDPASALEAAVTIQRTLAEHRAGHGFAPQVRIGLHDAEASARAMDYAGKGVHEAARIGALAQGGQIVASCDTVRGSAARFPVSEPRSVTLKGVSEPVDVVNVEWAVPGH